MSDVLQRLRAANPVTDLESLRSEEEAVVLPRAPRARHRSTSARRVTAVGFVAVVAALVLAVGLPGDRSSRPGGLVGIGLAPAVAATLEPGDSILHIVTRTSQSGPRGAEHTWRTDVWLAPGGGGRVRVSPENGAGPSSSFTDENARDPAAALHDMLEDGSLRSVGRATLEGRAVETFRTPDDKVVLYADAETMQPARSVLERGSGQDRLIAVTDFLRIERLANTPENRRVHDLPVDS